MAVHEVVPLPTQVPGLGVQVRRGEAGIIVDPVGGISGAVGEDSGEIEAKAVDAIGLVPERQGVGDQLLGEARSAREVEIVAGAGGVGEIEPVRGRPINLGQRLAHQVVALGRQSIAVAPGPLLAAVVVDHVHEHRDAARVQGLDQLLELGHLCSRHGGVAGLRRQEVGGHVAPVVEAPGRVAGLLVVFHHRHQLDGVDAELDQMVEACLAPGRGGEAGAGQAQIGAALRGGQAVQEPGVVLHVQLVEDQVLRRDRDVAGRRVGGMIVDDALAAAGIDRCRDVDEWRGGEDLGEADVLGPVGVGVAEAVDGR